MLGSSLAQCLNCQRPPSLPPNVVGTHKIATLMPPNTTRDVACFMGPSGRNCFLCGLYLTEWSIWTWHGMSADKHKEPNAEQAAQRTQQLPEGGLVVIDNDKPLTLDFTVVEKNERSITITIELAML